MRLPLVLLALLSLVAFTGARPVKGKAPAVEGVPATVKAIKSEGYPAPVLCLTPEAFPIAIGYNTDGTVSPVAAVAVHGKGRVVAVGHPDYLENPVFKYDTESFLAWAVRWTAGGKAKPKVTAVANGRIAEVVRKLGFTCAVAPSVAQAKGADVLVLCGTKEPKELVRFVSAGGGVVFADLPWAWRQGRDNGGENSNLALHYPGNQFLASVGLLMCDGGLSAGETDSYRVPTAFPAAANPSVALDKAIKGDFADDAERKQVAKTLIQAVDALPPGTAGWHERFDKLAKSPLAKKVPSAQDPLGPADYFARIAAVYRKNAWQAEPSVIQSVDQAAKEYPGLVKTGAKPVAESVTVDCSVPRWHSTGLYAPPGALVSVSVPGGATKLGLGVRVGSTADDLTQAKSEWMRAPLVTVQVPLDRPKVTVSSPFGGFVYVVVPTWKTAKKTLSVKIDGAVKAPSFVLGRDKNADWRQMLASATTPQVEIASPSLIVTLPLSDARKLSDPEGVMAFWEEALGHYSAFLGLTGPRPYPERVCCDVQLAAGYLHSGYPIMAPCDMAGSGAFLDVKQIRAKGAWGIFHELGHNHQRKEWTWEGLGEISVNFFSLYLSEKMCGLKPREAFPPWTTEAMARSKIADWRNSGKPYSGFTSDPFLGLQLFIRLEEAYGTDILARLVQAYGPKDLPTTDQEKIDLMALKLSDLTKTNVAAVFEAWSIPISGPTAAKCARHPAAPAAVTRDL